MGYLSICKFTFPQLYHQLGVRPQSTKKSNLLCLKQVACQPNSICRWFLPKTSPPTPSRERHTVGPKGVGILRRIRRKFRVNLSNFGSYNVSEPLYIDWWNKWPAKLPCPSSKRCQELLFVGSELRLQTRFTSVNSRFKCTTLYYTTTGKCAKILLPTLLSKPSLRELEEEFSRTSRSSPSSL